MCVVSMGMCHTFRLNMMGAFIDMLVYACVLAGGTLGAAMAG